MPTDVVRETLTSSSAISTCRPSGRSDVGHQDHNPRRFRACHLSDVSCPVETRLLLRARQLTPNNDADADIISSSGSSPTIERHFD